jgi:hypothetical protein
MWRLFYLFTAALAFFTSDYFFCLLQETQANPTKLKLWLRSRILFMFPLNGLEHLPLLLGLVALVELQLLCSSMGRQEE